MNATRRPFVLGADESRATTADGRPILAHGASLRRPWLTVAIMILTMPPITGLPRAAAEAADGPPAPVSPPSTAAGQPQNPPAPFQPQELSVGEPISLPNAAPLPARGTSSPTSPPAAAAGPRVQAAVPPAADGTGWLGLAVDETLLTGRLVVVEVAADSPAALAGVRQQDVLLAINGTKVQTADEMAAALAAIAPGQRVKVAVGRDSKVDDLVLTAAARPAEARSRNWQSAADAEPGATPSRSILAVDDTSRPTAAVSPPGVPALAAPQPAAVAVGSAGQSPPPTTFIPPPAPLPAALPSAPPSQPIAAPSTPAPAFQASAPPPTGFVVPTPAVPRPAAVATAAPSPASGRLALGVRTVPVDPAVQSRFQMADGRGAYVIGVIESLPAAKAGVPPGSVIVALNQQPVRSPQELTQLVTHGPAGTPVTLQYVLPGGQSRHASVVLQSLDEPLERALVGTEPVPGPAIPGPLQAAPQPQTARRVEPAWVSQPRDTAPLSRLEEALHRMATQLERIDQRLERLESRR